MYECNKLYSALRIGIQLLVILSLCIAFPTCSQKDTPIDKIHIVVSILPLAEFTEKIGGNKVDVLVMIPPGASPHSYEPRPGQFTRLSKAQLYVKLGTPIEFELVWLEKILSTNKDISVCNASKGIELITTNPDHGSGENRNATNIDPHVWLSPKNAKVIVENIYSALITIDPDNQLFYQRNREQYLSELESLDQDITALLQKKKARKFMTYHPAWGYFARTYNLDQIPVEFEGKNPTAKRLQKLIKQAREEDIRIILASPQFNTKSAEVIAREIQGQVILIDPLEKGYIANLKKIASILDQTME
jgi:zinc transport system substrate-binding protein